MDNTRLIQELEALDRRLRNFENGNTAVSFQALYDMRQEMDALKRAVYGSVQGQAAAPVRVPPSPFPQGAGDAADRPPYVPSPRRRLDETAIGKYFVSILAAVLVLLSVCVAVGSFWGVMPDWLRFVTVMSFGCMMAVSGGWKMLRKETRFNGFWQALSGCGFMVAFCGIMSGAAIWDLYGTVMAGFLFVGWFAGCFFCARKSGSWQFYLLSYLGGGISMLLGVARVDYISHFPPMDVQVLACLMPACVLGVGLYSARKDRDCFLWFLNGVFSVAAIGILGMWVPYATDYGFRLTVLTGARIGLAAVMIYSLESAFSAGGGFRRVMGSAADFASAMVLCRCVFDAFPQTAGYVVAAACLSVLFFGLEKPATMAVGTAPVSAMLVAGLAADLGPIGYCLPAVAAISALLSEYGVSSIWKEAAVLLFSGVAMYAPVDGIAYGPMREIACLAAVAGTVTACVIGYMSRRKHGFIPGCYTGLGIAAFGCIVLMSYMARCGIREECVLLTLACGCGTIAWHKGGVKGFAAKAAATAVLFLLWLSGFGFDGGEAVACGLRCAVVAGVPAAVLWQAFRDRTSGYRMRAAVCWCDIGLWLAARDVIGLTPETLCWLVLICFSGSMVWLGFREPRKDVRVTGLVLTILHVLGMTFSMASRGSTGSIVLSLLGAGAVCFGVSFAYNKFSSGLDDCDE